MALAPIVLFVYNRPSHLQKAVEALKNNELAKSSDLFIFSDAPKNEQAEKNVAKVRKYVKGINGFHSLTVVEREENFGLARSITSGVTEIVNQFGMVIVLEDDLITSPYFLKFMNEGLEFYKDNEQVISIHGYIYPIKAKLPETYFIRGADCLGWATWKRGWNLFERDGEKLLDEVRKRGLTKGFDFNGSYRYTRMLKREVAGKIESWAIRWYASAFVRDCLTLYPGHSLVNHIGDDYSGTHVHTSDCFKATLWDKPIVVGGIDVQENLQAREVIESYFREIRMSIIWQGTLNYAKRAFTKKFPCRTRT